MKKILVVGATSRIAECAARIWAARGDHLFLVGRNGEKLAAIAADLRVRGSARVEAHVMDANDFTAHAPMIAAAESFLGGIDTALIAHGSLSDQRACETDVEKLLAETNTNAISAIALLTILGESFEKRRAGTLGVISSVAGDRGREINYVYGSAKAMVSAFASGLAQRLAKSGVSVVTIKPGFVDTPMTASFKKGLLWASPESVAARIVRTLERGRGGTIYVPWFWRPIMMIIRSVPDAIFLRLKL